MPFQRSIKAFSRTRMTTLSISFGALAALQFPAIAQAATIDQTPPRVTAFALGGVVDPTAQDAAAIAHMTITDDLSGVQAVVLTLRSPSGAQAVDRWDVLNSGLRSYSGDFAVGAQSFSDRGLSFSRYSEAGTWTVDSLFITDLAGNIVTYTASQLAAFGPTTVSVVKDGPWDAIAPILIGGEVGPAKVSLSAPPKGTSAAQALGPIVAGAVHGFDPGNGVSSGIYWAQIEMVLYDKSGHFVDQFVLDGRSDGPGLAETTVRVAGHVRPDQAPGRYVVNAVTLIDMAGNNQSISDNLPTAFPKGMTVTLSR